MSPIPSSSGKSAPFFRIRPGYRPSPVLLRRACCLLLLTAGCLFSESVGKSVQTGLRLCIEQLIPSLFFFVSLAALFPPPAGRKRKGKLPAGFFGMLFLTAAGGFPVGALCTRRALESGRLTPGQARLFSCVLVSCGPGFLLGFLAGGLRAGQKAGLLLLLSELAVLFCFAGTACFLCRKERPEAGVPDLSADSFPAGIRRAVRSMAEICGSVLFFCGLRGALFPLAAGLPERLRSVLAGLLEVAGGCSSLTGFSYHTTLLLYAFFCGFGGFCVHLQIYSILQSRPHYLLFLFIRLLAGAAAAGCFQLLTLLFPLAPPDASCFSPAGNVLPESSSVSPAVFLLLIFTTLLFCASSLSVSRRDP